MPPPSAAGDVRLQGVQLSPASFFFRQTGSGPNERPQGTEVHRPQEMTEIVLDKPMTPEMGLNLRSLPPSQAEYPRTVPHGSLLVGDRNAQKSLYPLGDGVMGRLSTKPPQTFTVTPLNQDGYDDSRRSPAAAHGTPKTVAPKSSTTPQHIRKNRVLEAFPVEIFGTGTLRKEFYLPLHIANVARSTLDDRGPPYIKMINPLSLKALNVRRARLAKLHQPETRASEGFTGTTLADELINAGEKQCAVLSNALGCAINLTQLSLGIAMIDYVKEGCHSRDTTFFMLYMLNAECGGGSSAKSTVGMHPPGQSVSLASVQSTARLPTPGKYSVQPAASAMQQMAAAQVSTLPRVVPDRSERWMIGTEPGKWFVFAVVDIVELPSNKMTADPNAEPRIAVETDNLMRIAMEYNRYLLKKEVPPRSEDDIAMRSRRGRRPKQTGVVRPSSGLATTKETINFGGDIPQLSDIPPRKSPAHKHEKQQQTDVYNRGGETGQSFGMARSLSTSPSLGQSAFDLTRPSQQPSSPCASQAFVGTSPYPLQQDQQSPCFSSPLMTLSQTTPVAAAFSQASFTQTPNLSFSLPHPATSDTSPCIPPYLSTSPQDPALSPATSLLSPTQQQQSSKGTLLYPRTSPSIGSQVPGLSLLQSPTSLEAFTFPSLGLNPFMSPSLMQPPLELDAPVPPKSPQVPPLFVF